MFGTYRILLALFVVIGHLHGPFNLAVYAVFGFYVLSGYLMTRIMQDTYGYGGRGCARFALNRVLRIFPSYWAVAVLTLAILWTGDGWLTEYHKRIFVPVDAEGWVRNATLVFAQGSSPRLSPATWALTVELFYYALIGLGLSRTSWISVVWLAGSVLYTLVLIGVAPYNWEARYFPVSAASLPFSIGACLFHFRAVFDRMPVGRTLREPATWFGLVCANFALFMLIDSISNTGSRYSLTFGFYVNLFLTTCCLAALLSKGFFRVSVRTDEALGRFSYPLYLTHWLAGGLAAAFFFAEDGRSHTTPGGVLFFATGLALALCLSWLLIRLVDDPVERFRQRIRAGARNVE